MFTKITAVRKNLIPLLLPILVAMLFTAATAGAEEEKLPAKLPVPGTVTLVELGAISCLPCRMLAPIITELKQEYQGRAAIFHIDVYIQHEAAMKFHPMVTPTLIYFDRHGHEALRVSGFQEKAVIVKELDKLLSQK